LSASVAGGLEVANGALAVFGQVDLVLDRLALAEEIGDPLDPAGVLGFGFRQLQGGGELGVLRRGLWQANLDNHLDRALT